MAHSRGMRNARRCCALSFSAFSRRRRALSLLALNKGGVMSLADRYRQFATDCVRAAHDSSDPGDRALLLEMAEAWRQLAERAGKAGDDEGA